MAGLVPAIRVFLARSKDVDGRHKAGHVEESETGTPGSDERRETMRDPESWWGRDAAPRRALVAAAVVLVALVAAGALGLAYALAALAIVVAAAWIGNGRRARVHAMAPQPERRGPRPGDPLVEA